MGTDLQAHFLSAEILYLNNIHIVYKNGIVFHYFMKIG